jgi:Tfp pilus assembly protein PilF
VNFVLLFLIFVFAITLYGLWSTRLAGQSNQRPSQGPPEQGLGASHSPIVVRAEISAGNSSTNAWTVELTPLRVGVARKTTPGQDGFFEFLAVTPGEHELRVIDAEGRMRYHDVFRLRPNHETLAISVPSAELAQHPQPDAISVQRLQHKVPCQAMIEFRKGVAALKNRQVMSAVEHLKAAVAIDPAFADAHSDLGVAYLRSKEYHQSAEQFQKAIDLVPSHQAANENLCMLLLRTKRYAEAGQAAGRLLRRGAGSAKAHYVAAVSLLAGRGSQSEALKHLRRAEDAIPKARLLAASILAHTGRRTDAAHELETYLCTPDRYSRRPQVEAWLAELRQ